MSDNDLWITVEGTDGPGKGKHILFISVTRNTVRKKPCRCWHR